MDGVDVEKQQAATLGLWRGRRGPIRGYEYRYYSIVLYMALPHHLAAGAPGRSQRAATVSTICKVLLVLISRYL